MEYRAKVNIYYFYGLAYPFIMTIIHEEIPVIAGLAVMIAAPLATWVVVAFWPERPEPEESTTESPRDAEANMNSKDLRHSHHVSA